jgi:hypothetical protein
VAGRFDCAALPARLLHQSSKVVQQSFEEPREGRVEKLWHRIKKSIDAGSFELRVGPVVVGVCVYWYAKI